MRKGISPIVAVVLLIAIAVIAAVGLYFWVGGLATQQPTPDKPVVISALDGNCTSNETTNQGINILVQNLDPSSTYADKLYVVTDNGDTCTNETIVSIAAASQQSIDFSCGGPGTDGGIGGLTSGSQYVVYGTANVGSASFIC